MHVLNAGSRTSNRSIMRPVYWAILLAVAVAIGGVIFGVAGIFLAPLLGVVGVIALIIWTVERKAQDKPPLE